MSEQTIESVTDTPRSAYAALERRATLITVGILLCLAGIAWWSTIRQSHDMAGMVQAMGRAGGAMPFDLSVPVFMGMWVVMMIAMMFPTVAPIVLLHRMVLRRRRESPLLSVAFASGYLIVWAATGVIPLLILIGFRHVARGSAWVDTAGGGVLVVAGIYQFTRWKDSCLKACRTPLTFMMTHDFGEGPRGAIRTGVSHGLYCLGCCWALMAVLFVVGLMNLAWMAGITVVFLAEKNWRYGRTLTKVVGSLVIALGIVVLIRPSILGSVAPAREARTGATMTRM